MELFDRDIWHKNAPSDLGKSDCPFCKDEAEYMLWEGKHWKVLYNKYPYLGIQQHIMAVPKLHIIESADIPSEVYAEMNEVHQFVKEFFNGEKYFSFTRETFGDRSLEHLHMHFLPGIIYGDNVREMLKNQGF